MVRLSRAGRRVSALACSVAVVVSGVFAVTALTSPASAAPASTNGSYTALSPARLLDTRGGVGAPKAAVAGNSGISLQVTGAGGVPATGVSAVVLNVTVTAATRSGFVTVYPDGTARPTASNVNYAVGLTVPNLVVVRLGANGKVTLFNSGGGTIQLVADVSGYYTGTAPGVTPTDPGAFGALAPARLLDTRNGTGATRVGAVGPNTAIALQVTGRGGVPAANVSAVVLNVTVTAPQRSGFLTVYPSGTAIPTASNVNFAATKTVPSLVMVKVGADGKVNLYNGTGGTIQIVADVSGYYLAGTPVNDGAFGALAPARLLDTRGGNGAPRAAVAGNGVVSLQVTGRGGVPATNVSAVVLNVTVTAPQRTGFVSVYPDHTFRSAASSLNFGATKTVSNLVVARVGTNGKVDLYNGTGGTIQLVADVSGYFLGAGAPPTTIGTIAGTVTTGVTPLAGVEVYVLPKASPDADTADPIGTATTAANGSYSIGEIPVSSTGYAVCFDGADTTSTTGYIAQCFNNTVWDGFSNPANPTLVPVAGNATSTANANLAVGGAISGLVLANTDAHPLRDALVFIVNAGNLVAVTTTATDGSYTAKGLPASAGDSVCFLGDFATNGTVTGYSNVCYQNVPFDETSDTPPAGAPLVPVTVGAITPNISQNLAVVPQANTASRVHKSGL
jgi:hypothetical protein